MTNPLNHIGRKWQQLSSNAPLVSFRILFGIVMMISVLRFWAKGWIEELYIDPVFHFSYYGFEWIQDPGRTGMYLLFIFMFLGATGIFLGAWYRVSAMIFFSSFTYVELIDKTTYLNHYYFVSLVAFLLIFLPAHRRLSIDVFRKPGIYRTKTPLIHIHLLKFQLGIVYFFAGIAKINSDWLFRAQPLRIWLTSFAHLPVIGSYFLRAWPAFLFSWTGMIFDILAPFGLFWRKSRKWMYAAVVIFHLATGLMFPIGMFPLIMIALTTIFFSSRKHEWVLSGIERIFYSANISPTVYSAKRRDWMMGFVGIWLIIQLALPFRHLLYPGNLFWHEQGYRFSWRVMLMEKTGYCEFTVANGDDSHFKVIDNREYLTPLQEKMMATQPDMILQFAHHLGSEFKKTGWNDLKVYVDSRVSLQGERSRRFVKREVDLMEQSEGWKNKEWLKKSAVNTEKWQAIHVE